MKKKFLSVLSIMFVFMLIVTNVHATEGLFHIGAYSDIYKLSEQGNIDLPFLNVFTKAATYDKAVTHSGISFGETTIDINEKLEGMHVLVSTDMITIKGEIENSFIYANNVVVEGKISGDTIIIAPTVQILEGATVQKDIIVVANNLDIKGKVEGSVIATVSEMARISGTINKDLRIIAQNLALENGTIKGNIYIETNADVTAVKEKYPEATVKTLNENVNQKIDWMGIITKGIITVVIYSMVCFFVTRKENNIAKKALNKFNNNTAFGLLLSVVLLMLLIVLPLLLVLLAMIGFGIVAWPVLVAYLALILLVGTTSMLIVGTVIYEAIRTRVTKFRLPIIVSIFALLYVLTQITVVASYANMAMLLIALAIVVIMIVKKEKV